MRRQFLWSIAGHGAAIVIPLAAMVVLARVLDPVDFGIFALASVTVMAIETMTTAPLGEVIIQSRRRDVADFILSLQLILGVLGIGALYLSAPYIGALFHSPTLVGPLRAMAAVLVITPFVEVAVRLKMRQLDFKTVFIRQVAAPLGNCVIAVWLGWRGAGVWALVFGILGGRAISGAILLAIGGWMPRLQLNFRKFRGDVGFSAHMVWQGGLRWARNQSDKAFLGHYGTREVVGHYEVAQRIVGLPFGLLADAIGKVTYATM